jgi:hypothetical protein
MPIATWLTGRAGQRRRVPRHLSHSLVTHITYSVAEKQDNRIEPGVSPAHAAPPAGADSFIALSQFDRRTWRNAPSRRSQHRDPAMLTDNRKQEMSNVATPNGIRELGTGDRRRETSNQKREMIFFRSPPFA